MRVAAIIQVDNRVECRTYTLPYTKDEDELWSMIQDNLKVGIVVDIYRNVMHHVVNRQDNEPTIIVDTICKALGRKPEWMAENIRNRDRTRVRAIIAHHLTRMTKLRLRDIGDIFGGKDHSTVIHAVKNYSDWYETDDDFIDLADMAQQALQEVFNKNVF